jgi:hypothetical protein
MSILNGRVKVKVVSALAAYVCIGVIGHDDPRHRAQYPRAEQMLSVVNSALGTEEDEVG